MITGKTLEFNWLKVYLLLGEKIGIYFGYLNLFLDTIFSTSLPNFKSLALTCTSINCGHKNNKILAF